MHLCGLADPVLWGCVAFLLNYVPILGPLTGVGVFFLVGLMSFDTVWHAFVTAVVYLSIHFIEGEFLTPLILARRFTLNPVLVIFSLIFWNWMWGIPGRSSPSAARRVQDHLRPGPPLMALGHFIGG